VRIFPLGSHADDAPSTPVLARLAGYALALAAGAGVVQLPFTRHARNAPFANAPTACLLQVRFLVRGFAHGRSANWP